MLEYREVLNLWRMTEEEGQVNIKFRINDLLISKHFQN